MPTLAALKDESGAELELSPPGRVRGHRAWPSSARDVPSGANPGWSWAAGSSLPVPVLPIPQGLSSPHLLDLDLGGSGRYAPGTGSPGPRDGPAPGEKGTSRRALSVTPQRNFFLGEALSTFSLKDAGLQIFQ